MESTMTIWEYLIYPFQFTWAWLTGQADAWLVDQCVEWVKTTFPGL